MGKVADGTGPGAFGEAQAHAYAAAVDIETAFPHDRVFLELLRHHARGAALDLGGGTGRYAAWLLTMQLATSAHVIDNGSVTKRVLSSTASKAHGSSSWHGMACEFAHRPHLLEDSATSLLLVFYTRRCSGQGCPETFLLRFLHSSATPYFSGHFRSECDPPSVT
jgi:hypothetical protein